MEATAGAVRTAFIADSSKFSPTMQKMIRQSTELGNAATVAGRKVAQAGHAGVQPWMASSAALRLASGDITNNIRAAERFIATMPGVAKAVQTIFPVVGAIALAAVFSRMIEGAAKFIEKMRNVDRTAQTTYSGLVMGITTSNDALQMSNDKLDITIAKLEHLPSNSLAIALDEAKSSADRLYDSLTKDSKALDDMFKANEPGFAGVLFGGQASTVGIESLGKAYSFKSGQLALQRRQALSGVTDKGQISSINAHYDQLAQANDSSTIAAAQRLQKSSNHSSAIMTGIHAATGLNLPGMNNTGVQYDAQALIDSIHGRQLDTKEQATHDAKTQAVIDLENKKRQAEYAKAAAAALNRTSTEFSASARRPSNLMDLWERQQVRLRKAREAKLALTGQSSADVSQYLAQSNITQKWNALPQTDVATRRTESYDTQRQAINDSHEATALQIARQQQTGQMSAHQAALATATNDTKAYNAQCKLLTDTLEDINKIVGNTLTQAQRDAQSKPYRAALLKLPGSHAAQMAKDADALQDATWQAGINAGAQNFFQQYTPDKIAANLTGDTLSSINNSITSGITTGKFHGASMVRGIAGDVGKQALGGLESKFLGPMFAKLGTKGNPMYVKSADGVAGKAVSGLKSLFGGSHSGSSSDKSGLSKLFSGFKSLFSSSGSSSDGSSGGGFLDKLFSTAATAVPFLAGGGDLGSGMAAIIGENGPELFRPKNAGTVIPNHKIASAMGGGSGVINVDARGAMDPAATATAVNNAIRASARATQKNVARSQHESKMRSPAHA